MTDPHPLVAFLRADLDRMERTAHGALGGGEPWSVYIGDHYYVNAGGHPVANISAPDNAPDVVRQVADHDPRSTLARVEAERRILDLHPAHDSLGNPVCATCEAWYIDEGEGTSMDVPSYPCPTLRALAAGHRYSPGFQMAWLDEAETVRVDPLAPPGFGILRDPSWGHP